MNPKINVIYPKLSAQEEFDLERSTGAVAYYAHNSYYCEKRGMHSFPGFSELRPIDREAWQYVADKIAKRIAEELTKP